MRHPLASAAGLFASKWWTIGFGGRARRLGPPRRRAGAGADLAGSGGDLRRPGVPGRAGRPLVRLRARPAASGWASASRPRAGLPRPHRRRAAPRLALELLDLRDDRLRGRDDRCSARCCCCRTGWSASGTGAACARRRGGNPVRRLRHRDQGAHGHGARRLAVDRQPLDAGRAARLGRRLLRLGPRPAGRRGPLGDRAHLGVGERVARSSAASWSSATRWAATRSRSSRAAWPSRS